MDHRTLHIWRELTLRTWISLKNPQKMLEALFRGFLSLFTYVGLCLALWKNIQPNTVSSIFIIFSLYFDYIFRRGRVTTARTMIHGFTLHVRFFKILKFRRKKFPNRFKRLMSVVNSLRTSSTIKTKNGWKLGALRRVGPSETGSRFKRTARSWTTLTKRKRRSRSRQ